MEHLPHARKAAAAAGMFEKLASHPHAVRRRHRRWSRGSHHASMIVPEVLMSLSAQRPARTAARPPVLLRISWIGLTIIGLFFAIASVK
jgi:hypothetical protein